MQKQKINYLTLQSNYDQIEFGLFNNQTQIDFVQISKFVASSQLIPAIHSCLNKNQLELCNLDFIGANLGPAPFTTLRTTIVTVNGIAYASQIPLVGVNGLVAFAQNSLPSTENLIIILNAFSKSIYYAIRSKQQIIYGWQMVDQFIIEIKAKFQNQNTTIIGLGINNFDKELASLPNNFNLDNNYLGYPTINMIAHAGLELYQNGQYQTALTPLYLKQAEPLVK